MKKLIVLFLILSLAPICSFSRGKTSVMFNSFLEKLDLSKARPWQAPDYSNQTQALGI